MPKFAANLTMLFPEVPFLERFEAAARAGFEAVEFLFPYAFPLDEIRARLAANRLQLVLHNLPAGQWDAGERGIACLPDRTEEFRAGVAEAIRYATGLGVAQLNCLAGKTPAGVPAPARSTTPGCSVTSTAWAMQAGSAASTSPPVQRRMDWAGGSD